MTPLAASFNITGLPALLIILAILVLIVVGIVTVIRSAKRRIKQPTLVSAVHGLGPTVALSGALLAAFGLTAYWRVGSDAATDDTGPTPRLARFNEKASRVLRRVAWLGAAVAVVGLLIWAVRH